MAFKIIKWFKAIIASVQCFAGGRAKAADYFSMVTFTMWTLNCHLFIALHTTAGSNFMSRWCNAVSS